MNKRPSVIVFDVNETLSNMAPMAQRFGDVGAPAAMSGLWFAQLLRDGFALAAAGDRGSFAAIGADILRGLLRGVPLDRDLEEAVAYITAGLAKLQLHPDIAGGIRLLKESGMRLVTLSNGAAAVADGLLGNSGLRSEFEMLLSVEQAPSWKPVRAAYDYAADACAVRPGEMLLVAVHPWDIHGAARAGLQTAWINRGNEEYPRHFAAPDVTVRQLGELAEQLGGGERTLSTPRR